MLSSPTSAVLSQGATEASEAREGREVRMQ